MSTAVAAAPLTAEEAAEFAERCRQFLAAHTTPGGRRNLAAGREFLGALAEAGPTPRSTGAPASRWSTSASTARSPRTSRT